VADLHRAHRERQADVALADDDDPASLRDRHSRVSFFFSPAHSRQQK
jgi:hypothetical protein